MFRPPPHTQSNRPEPALIASARVERCGDTASLAIFAGALRAVATSAVAPLADRGNQHHPLRHPRSDSGQQNQAHKQSAQPIPQRVRRT